MPLARNLLAVIGAVALAAAAFSCSMDREPVDDAAAADPTFLPARVLYRTHCNACHGRNGLGSENLFPPLRGSEWVLGNPEIPIRIVLHGVQGEIEVGGRRYLNHMVGLGQRLSDEEVASIVTYVRASWGNRASAVSPEEVTRVRLESGDRERTWSPEELAPLGLGAVRDDSLSAVPAPS